MAARGNVGLSCFWQLTPWRIAGFGAGGAIATGAITFGVVGTVDVTDEITGSVVGVGTGMSGGGT